jgi:hypothetical protein
VARALNRSLLAKLSVAAALFLLVLQPESWAATLVASPDQAYPNTSWAIGVVVPEGAGLQGGGSVKWESITNVTAQVTLPNITLPDGVIYAVLSVMTDDGVVLQAAAGISPNSSSWLAYSWSVANSNSGEFTYNWVLNGSEPTMPPDGNVSMSIFQAARIWEFRVSDSDTNSSVVERFPSGISPSLKVGDQEVFALESYSRAGTTFQSMGNLTLHSLLLNGQKVVSRVYTYSQWDPDHNPVFVVGSSGTSPPSFMYIGQTAGGSFFWDYVGIWKVTGDPLVALIEILVLVMLIVALSLLGTAIWIMRKPARVKPAS